MGLRKINSLYPEDPSVRNEPCATTAELLAVVTQRMHGEVGEQARKISWWKDSLEPRTNPTHWKGHIPKEVYRETTAEREKFLPLSWLQSVVAS